MEATRCLALIPSRRTLVRGALGALVLLVIQSSALLWAQLTSPSSGGALPPFPSASVLQRAKLLPPTTSGYPGEGTGLHWWIDGQLGDDSNPGTQAQPWRTVDRIESATFSPGDLVHILSGTYPIQGSLRLTGISGSSQAWIGITAVGQVKLRNSALQNVVNVDDCHYLFLRGFEITHANDGVPYGSWDPVDGIKFVNSVSTNVTIDRCDIHDLGNVGIGSQAPEIRNVSVIDCEIRNCFVGLYWGYYEAPNKNYAYDGYIARNYVHDCPPVDLDGTGYGIQIKGGSSGNIIEDNVLVNVAGNSRAAIAVYHISTNLGLATNRNVIRRNFIRASRNEGIYATEGALIENNILVDCANVGISVTKRNTGYGVFYGNLTIRNNTVFGINSASGQALFTGVGPVSLPQQIANNLLLVTAPGQVSLRLPQGFAGTASQNYCLGATIGSTQGVVPVVDLRVVLSSTYGETDFLYPKPAGALVSSADPLFSPFHDFHRMPRDIAPDVGAFESTGGSNPGWVLGDGFKR
jgi:hypothetical protein